MHWYWFLAQFMVYLLQAVSFRKLRSWSVLIFWCIPYDSNIVVTRQLLTYPASLRPTAMSGTRISPEAFSKLRELSKWVHGTQKFEQELTHLSRCVDEDRHAKIRPLLKELGFDIKVGRYDSLFYALVSWCCIRDMATKYGASVARFRSTKPVTTGHCSSLSLLDQAPIVLPQESFR